MAKSNTVIPVITLVLIAVTLVLVAVILFGPGSGNGRHDYAIEKNLAGELVDNNLYNAAVEEYRKILSDRDLDNPTRANLNYLTAKIYFDHLRDYEQAAAHYVRARTLNPEGSFYDEAGKNLIVCLEKMGRLVDAKRELDKTVNIDSIQAAHEGEKMVAKIDQKPIYLSDLDKEIQKMPPEVQKQYVTREGKTEFLKSYIASELMYQAAIREGFDRDPKIMEQKQMLERQLLVEKYAMEKVLPEINIDTADIRNYYLAHKSNKYEDKEYDEVRSQVFMDYQQEKAQQAFTEYIGRLSQASNVQMFEENLK